jgi:hypothetical protein
MVQMIIPLPFQTLHAEKLAVLGADCDLGWLFAC